METVTLREMCETYGVSRRMVQRYEAAGLVHAVDRNKYGHLLYDKDAQKRIQRIRLLQEMGFKLYEIGEIMDAPNETKIAVIRKQMVILKEGKHQIDQVIDRAQQLICFLEAEK